MGLIIRAAILHNCQMPAQSTLAKNKTLSSLPPRRIGTSQMARLFGGSFQRIFPATKIADQNNLNYLDAGTTMMEQRNESSRKRVLVEWGDGMKGVQSSSNASDDWLFLLRKKNSDSDMAKCEKWKSSRLWRGWLLVWSGLCICDGNDETSLLGRDLQIVSVWEKSRNTYRRGRIWLESSVALNDGPAECGRRHPNQRNYLSVFPFLFSRRSSLLGCFLNDVDEIHPATRGSRTLYTRPPAWRHIHFQPSLQPRPRRPFHLTFSGGEEEEDDDGEKECPFYWTSRFTERNLKVTTTLHPVRRDETLVSF